MNKEEQDDLLRRFKESGISGHSISLIDNDLSLSLNSIDIAKNDGKKMNLTISKPINFDDLTQDIEVQTKDTKRELHKSQFLINYINSLKNK